MKSASLLTVLIVSAGAAHGSVIFDLGNHPQPGEANILLGSGSTGMTVTGTPSGFPTFTVLFSSTQSLLEPSSGQARVSANPEGTPLTNLSISLASGTYADLIINPFLNPCRTCIAGNATVTVNAVDSLGNPEAPAVFTYALGNGSNFLTILTAGGEHILSTSLSMPGGINDLRQPRISGLAAPIPEPGTLALLFGGAAVFGLRARLRRRR